MLRVEFYVCNSGDVGSECSGASSSGKQPSAISCFWVAELR